MSTKKKLIEVALPLTAINNACAREKSIRHGHPSTLHLWWARRPLASARATLWASLVDDPSAHPDEFPTETDQLAERRRLFRILEELVVWENSNDPRVLKRAWQEIEKSTDGDPPPILDPFCGGGTIPLEAQRLGLTALGGDLNPIAILISKATADIPPRFSDAPPVHPKDNHRSSSLESWIGAQGLAEDVRYYGAWVRERAFARIGHLYPKGPNGETVMAWIWARTVRCSNPACGAKVPLVRSFELSKKTGNHASVEPIVDRSTSPPTVSFAVKTEPHDGHAEVASGTVNRHGARCICCDHMMPLKDVRSEGRAGRMDSEMIGAVMESSAGRRYGTPTQEHLRAAHDASPNWVPDTPLPEKALGFRVQAYGLQEFADLFTPRQLVALETFSELIRAARAQIIEDATNSGLADDGIQCAHGGRGVTAYADAIQTYLTLGLGKCADRWATTSTWDIGREAIRNTFARQAIQMTWDFAEANPFSNSIGNWTSMINRVTTVLTYLPPQGTEAQIAQRNAPIRIAESPGAVIVTDPPYYDMIGYSDLSDFFYTWFRPILKEVWPDTLSTIVTPKADEIIADPFRRGGKNKARDHFESGMRRVFEALATNQHSEYPASFFYAFKQAESSASGRTSTGWETFLEGLLGAGLTIHRTWPMRTEMANRLRGNKFNALASSIIIVCRPRPTDAPMVTRAELLQSLRRELPAAINVLEQQGLPPIDMEQAVIGPGMEVFSQYAKVVEADGTSMPVRDALSLINQVRQELLSEHEAELDSYTRWAVTWFTQHGMNPGPFGEAEQLAISKNTSVDGVLQAGLIISSAGQVRLIDRQELTPDWDPVADHDLTVWEATQHLLARLETGEEDAAALYRQLGRGYAERAATLARILYEICNRNGWMQEAVAYNGLQVAWPQIEQLAQQEPELRQGVLE